MPINSRFSMTISELSAKDKEKYDHFVEKHPLGSIHQTWDWGLFQSKSSQRDRFWVLALENDKGDIQASALIIRQKLPFKKGWLYCPRGPLLDYSNENQVKLLFGGIAGLAKKENAVFLRFDPGLTQSIPSPENSSLPQQHDITSNSHAQSSYFYRELTGLLKTLHSHPAHAHYQPENTLILDLKQSPDDILKQMKPKGRYNIKVAQKHGVQIRICDNSAENFSNDVAAFYQLLRQTTSRDEFSGHPLSYYQNMLSILGPQKARLYLAEYCPSPSKTSLPIAGMIVTTFRNTAIYYFGASSNEYRNTMAPYLLQWQAIQDAQKEGYQHYDFLGIAPENQPNHPWAGVTDFKLKFGGERTNYMPAQEIVYQPFWYKLIKLAKGARKK